MNGMKNPNLRNDILYGAKACFTCGFVDVDNALTDPFVAERCPECREISVVNFNLALDLLHDNYNIPEEDLGTEDYT